VLVVLMAIDFALSIPSNAFVGTLAGLQRYDLLNNTQVVLVFAQAAGWAIALALGGGLIALGAVTLAFSVIGQLIRYLIARRLVKGLSVSPRRVDRQLIRPFAGFSVWLGVEDAAYILLNRIDAVIVGLVLGVGAAGVYGVGQRLAIALGQLVQPVAGLFFPHSADLAARRDVDGLRNSFLTGTRLLLAVAAPLALALAILADPIIEAWVGSGFDAAAEVTVFLVAAVVVWVLIDTGISTLQGMGRPRRPAIIRAAETALNLGLSVLLAHLIGLEGVALATLLAAVAANLFVLLPQMCRQFGLRVTEFAGPLVAAHAPAAAAGLVVGWLVTRLEPSGLIPLIGAGAAITLAYVAVFAVTGLDSSERAALLRRVGWRSGPYVPPA
jgi:PST family polysaccharide transporter